MNPHTRPWHILAPGIRRQTQAVGLSTMQTLFDFDPHTTTPEHHHPHEQLVHILSGQITLHVNGTPHLLSAGDHFAIPPHTPHSASTQHHRALVLDTFTPLREDFLLADRQASLPASPTTPT